MGEIADGMINGEMCKYCGQYLHDTANIICDYGFEVCCVDCDENNDEPFVHDNDRGKLIVREN